MASRTKEAILDRNAKILAAIVALYGVALLRLRPTIVNFSDITAQVGMRGLPALRTTQGNELIRAIVSEIDAVGGEIASILEDAIGMELGFARADFAEEMAVLLPTANSAWFASNIRFASDRQIMSMFNFLAPDGALYGSLTAGYGRRMADKIVGALLAGLVGGRSPRDTASFITSKLGLALNDSLNIARTTTLWAYRLSSHATYLINSHVLSGWIWLAALDERTCMSCVHMHGSFHMLTEVLNDHHQGRCTPMPVTKSCQELGLPCDDEDSPSENFQRGEEWFNELSEAKQFAMMGPGIFSAWQSGEFEFSDLSVAYNDPVWGVMLRQATLRELTDSR